MRSFCQQYVYADLNRSITCIQSKSLIFKKWLSEKCSSNALIPHFTAHAFLRLVSSECRDMFTTLQNSRQELFAPIAPNSAIVLLLRNVKPKQQIADPTGHTASTQNMTLGVGWNVQPWVGALTWTQKADF